MNQKLAAWCGRKIRPDITHGRTGAPLAALVVASKSNEKGKRTVIRFSFHARAIKQLGWLHKDRLQMDITKDGGLVVFRGKGGCSLGKSTSSTDRMYVRFVVVKDFYEAFEPSIGINVEIKDGAIAFDL